MNFIEKLDLLIKENNISRYELAAKSGVPYSTITSLYDKGYEHIRLKTLKKLALYFGCTIDYLADDECNDKDKPFDYNDLAPREKKMVDTFLYAKKSDNPTVKTLYGLIVRELGITEHKDEK